MVNVGSYNSEKDSAYLDDGKAFLINMEYLLSVGSDVLQSILTPNTSTRIHFSLHSHSSGRSEIQLWEVPTVTAYSFSWTGKDRNRETTNTSAATVRAVSTVSANGSFLHKISNYGSGISVNASPIQEFPSFILDQNTEYLLLFKTYDASNLFTACLRWYEL